VTKGHPVATSAVQRRRTGEPRGSCLVYLRPVLKLWKPFTTAGARLRLGATEAEATGVALTAGGLGGSALGALTTTAVSIAVDAARADGELPVAFGAVRARSSTKPTTKPTAIKLSTAARMVLGVGACGTAGRTLEMTGLAIPDALSARFGRGGACVATASGGGMLGGSQLDPPAPCAGTRPRSTLNVSAKEFRLALGTFVGALRRSCIFAFLRRCTAAMCVEQARQRRRCPSDESRAMLGTARGSGWYALCFSSH
jgi:hypothetical protein